MLSEPIEVLLVEDDPGDVDLTKEAMETVKLDVNLRVVDDGEKAMAYLRKQGPYADASTPDLVILDLNLPRKDGRQVLIEIKTDETLKSIPVVILTTSEAPDNIAEMYALGANCYIPKPMGLNQFAQVVQAIENFWFTIVKLPPRSSRK